MLFNPFFAPAHPPKEAKQQAIIAIATGPKEIAIA